MNRFKFSLYLSVLISILLSLSSCDTRPELNVIDSDCVREGNHFFRLQDKYYSWGRSKYVAYRWFPTASNTYDTGDDQNDWLKMRGGADLHKISNHRNSLTPVNRWNPVDSVFEYGPYVHHAGNTYKPDYPYDNPYYEDMPIVSVKPGEWIEIHRNVIPEFQSVALTFITEDGTTAYYEHYFDYWPSSNKWEETRSHWGGTSKAPKDMCWYWQLIGYE